MGPSPADRLAAAVAAGQRADGSERGALEFYEVVEVLDSAETRSLNIVGRRGVVTGLPPHLLGITDDSPPSEPGADQYAVTVGEDGFAVPRRDLHPTGQKLSREELYDGSTIRVTVEGEMADMPESDPT